MPLPANHTPGQTITATDINAIESAVNANTAAVATKQTLDSDLTAIAALDSSTAGAIASDGAGWVKKTYAQVKTALGLTKADVGLGNVDNTADLSKPVSTAASAAFVARADARQAYVATAESTATTSYTDLTTTGPSVTATIGASGAALVILSAQLGNNTSGGYALMSVSATGWAASDTSALYIKAASTAADQLSGSYAFLASGLTPGSVTFTAKYRAFAAGSATFAARRLIVIPL